MVRTILIALLLASTTASAAAPLTLNEALREARAANARLPLAAFDKDIARAGVQEAKAQRWARFSVEGDLRYAPPGFSYNAAQTANEERLQAVAHQPLYEGGALAAGIAAAHAQLDETTARYRVAEKDLDLEVRTRFYELAKTLDELASRRRGIARLRTYLTGVRDRQAAGQGVSGDVLKTEVRLDNEEANIADTERRADEARLEVNDLMGRDPAAALAVAPLPPPSPPSPAMPVGAPWSVVPELRAADANLRAAAAAIAITRAERRPSLELVADIGWWGSGLTDDPMGFGFSQRLRNDAGASLMVSFSWSFWDFGIYRAQLRQAELGRDQARATRRVVFRWARLGSQRAHSDLVNIYRELATRARTVPTARDSYLQAESLYRGGIGTALEVLDAYAQWMDAENSYEDAVLRYRVAEATALRWDTP